MNSKEYEDVILKYLKHECKIEDLMKIFNCSKVTAYRYARAYKNKHPELNNEIKKISEAQHMTTDYKGIVAREVPNYNN